MGERPPAADVSSMLEGDLLQVRCDACGAAYVIAPEQVRAFRDQRLGLVS